MSPMGYTSETSGGDSSNPNGLPKSVIKQAFDAVRAIIPIPDMYKDDLQLKERQLRAAERRLQRRFIAEYKAQVSQVHDVLFERGVAVGTAIRDALLGDGAQVDMTYEDVVNAPKYKTPGLGLLDSKVSEQTRETLKILDPLIEPVLSSFVSGVEAPLNESVNDLKKVKGLIFPRPHVHLVFTYSLVTNRTCAEVGCGVDCQCHGGICAWRVRWARLSIAVFDKVTIDEINCDDTGNQIFGHVFDGFSLGGSRWLG